MRLRYSYVFAAEMRVAREGEHTVQLMRFGLVPFWSHGIAPKYSTINATVERLRTAPTFRGPWRRGQRCIVPVIGFYEWQVQPDGKKQPYFIHVTDRPEFGLAAVWDRSEADDGSAVESFAIITLPASPFMAEIHNAKKRQPAILRHEDHDAWLMGGPDRAFAALKPYPDDLLIAYRISTRVNAPKNNDAELIQPAA
jgi:putative SOS response-associated peptidase YedK